MSNGWGFVFQLSHICLVLLLLVLFVQAGNPFADAHAIMITTGLAADVILCAAALGSWRSMRAAARTDARLFAL